MTDDAKPIKMQLPTKAAQGKISHTKGMVEPAFMNNNSNPSYSQKFAKGETIYFPLTKAAQSIGGGMGVTVTQPMFFSPMHTPQNWQIASKRREVNQWARFYYENEPKVAAAIDFYCFTPDMQVLMSDGTQKSISSVEIGNFVVSHDGSVNKVVNKFSRYTNEEILKIKISGINGFSIKVTKGHEILCVRDGKEIFVQAQSLEEGDYVLTPAKYGKSDKNLTDKDLDFAWLLGVYAAEGCGIPHFHVSKKERKTESNKGVYFYCDISEKETLVKIICDKVRSVYGIECSVREISESSTCLVSAYGTAIAKDLCGLCSGTSTDGDKSFSSFIMKQPNEFLQHILGGFMSGDGCFNKNNGLQGVGVSKNLCEQICYISDRLGIENSFTISRSKHENRQVIYSARLSRRSCGVLEKCCYKIDSDQYIGDDFFAINIPYFVKDNYIQRKITSIEKVSYEGEVFDLEIEGKHSYVVNRISVHNSQFPINGFKLECKKKKVLKFFEKLVDNLNLLRWLRLISHERFLLGDVFVFLEVDCPHCHGTGISKDEENEICAHKDGTFKRIIVLNPDWIEVYTTVLADEPEIVLLPDDELKKIVQTRQPKHIFERLPDGVKLLVASGRPIRLSNTVTTHIKHGGSPYGTYGESILRRLFSTLAYKTKLMTANWIVAERMILPIRVVKIGEKERPASEEDIADVTQQLAAVANDPNLTIVTHHAFDYEWFGACHDSLTEILTPEGWKFFYDLNKDGIVATYNAEHGEMQWQQIDEYHEYDFKSTDTLKMHNFKTNGVDICVTPNHRMLVRRDGVMQEIYSQEVKHGDKFISTVDWKGRIPSQIAYKDSPLAHMALDDYLEFVGHYLGEDGGKIETKRGLALDKQIQACSFRQNRSSPIYSSMKEVDGLVYADFLEAEDDSANDVFCNFTINSVKIARYMAEEFGSRSEEKKIPRWIRDLPKDKLKIVYDTMIAGDGDQSNDHGKPSYCYVTISRQLADHFSEIALKLGYFNSVSVEKAKKPQHRDAYRIYWSEWKKETPFEIRQQHIARSDYDGKVYCVKVPNAWIITRRNGKMTIQGNTGKIHNITAELELIGKEILDGLMLNQALLNGEMGAYASAQIGAETMIMRLDNWRAELKEFIEKSIFLPVAKMQGFIDEEESKEIEEIVYLYPRVKWEDMRLRDNTNEKQMAIQLNQNGKISDRTMLEEYFDLNYDQEIEQIREEQVMASQNGQLPGGAAGGAGGAAGAMGGAGGAPMGGDPMAGGMGGVPMGGDPMAGGMGGAPGGAPMGGAPGGAPMGGGMAAAGAPAGKIYKKGKAPKSQEPSPEEMAAMQPVPIRLTKPEAKLYRLIKNMRLPFNTFAQYKQQVPGNSQPFVMDFAFPDLKLDVEADGEQWHTDPESKKSDNERDMKLANVGWTVIRFPESAINENIQQVQKVLEENVMMAAKSAKEMRKQSSAQGFVVHNREYDEKTSSEESVKSGYTSISVPKMGISQEN